MQLYCTVLLKMSKAKSDWMKVASKSKPGEFYYCNRHTKKCTWTAPPEFQASDKTTCVPQNIAKSAKNATKDQQQQRKELGERGEKEKEKKQPSARAQKPRPPKLNLQVSLLKSNSNNNGNVERAGSAPPPPTTAATDTSMDKDKTLGQPLTSATSGHNEPAAADGDGDIEEMDCEERWGDDGEVSMDFDLSEVQQEQLIAEISATRNTILPATTLDSFSLPSASPSTPLYQEMLYLVLDTNVLISHLQFLVELKDYAIKGVGKPVLVIPWVVMQELDALKTRDNASLASKAKKAIDLLHDCFSANHPRVRGQTMEEVQTESSNIAIGNNDDRILHCCLLYQEKVKDHGGLAVLFSNDIQLCSKAMLNQVRALNRKTLLNELRVLCRSAAHAPPTSYTHTKEYASRVAVAQKQAALFAFIDDLICQSESLVREGLAVIVKSEMVEAYKEIWIQIVIVKPPWSLMDLIHILDKHWIAVFGHVVDRSLKKTVDGLSSYASARHTMKIGSMLELETFHRLSFELLRAFQAKSDYGGVVTYCMTQLSVLGQKAVEAKSGHLPQSSDPSPPPPSPAAVPMTPTQPAPPMSLSIPSNTHPATSPSKLPPTPPVTPSSPSIPFFSVIPTHLEQLVQNIPVNPPDQLPWLLNVIMESIKYCHSHLLVTIQGDKVAAAHILADITKQLAALVAALNNLLRSQLDIQTLGSMVQAFDNFLINTLVVTSGNQSIKFNCPLSLSQLYELLRDSEPHRQLMHSAFAQFMHYLDIFNLLQQSL